MLKLELCFLLYPYIHVLITKHLQQAGLDKLQEAVDVVTKVITEHGGRIDVKIAPRVTSQQDESALASLMEQLELENREIDGDEPDE
jgi:translation initiation factor 2 subunit 1